MFPGLIEVHFARIQGFAYSIRCIHQNGSNAKGCVFVLVSTVEWVEDAFGVIEGVASGRVVVFLQNAGCYGEVLAFDLGDDNSSVFIARASNMTTDNISVAARTNITLDSGCPENTGGSIQTRTHKCTITH